MDSYLHFSKQANEPVEMESEAGSLDGRTAREWQKTKEEACKTVQQHTDALRRLMAEMRSFNHETSLKTVMAAQSRAEALRWLSKVIEREILRLDKGYREAAQREQFLRDQERLTAV